MATMKRARKRHAQCPNCGRGLNSGDHFCPNCGQENHDLHVPIWHLVSEALEGFFHVDGKTWSTLGALIARPGFLTSEFSAGRRVRYVPPVRLYVFISFVFFLLLSFSPTRHETDDSGANTWSLSFHNLNSRELRGLTDAQVDSLLAARGIERTSFNLYIASQLRRIADGGREEFGHRMLKGVSYTMFVLMPIFALLVYLFYRKRAGYYLDCLIFSVHVHSFAFLLLSFVTVIRWMADNAYLVLFTPLFLIGYLFPALRRTYGEGWGWVSVKTILLSVTYATAIVFCFITMTFVNLMLF